MSEPAVTLKPLGAADLPGAVRLSKAVGWPHRCEDWAIALKVGEGIGAFQGNELVGTTLWWPFEPRASRLGLVTIAPLYQRKGLGRRMMNEALARLDGRAIALTSTAEGEPLHRTLGFKDAGFVRQQQGISRGGPRVRGREGTRLRPLQTDDWDRVLRLDQAALGYERKHLLTEFLRETVTIVSEHRGRITGFASLRDFGRGRVIGPVIAEDRIDAEELIFNHLDSVAGEFARVDIPDDERLSAVLSERGLAIADTYIRMTRGAFPEASGPARVYTQVTQTVG